MRKKLSKKPNHAARELAKPLYRQRIVRSKKAYTRKPRNPARSEASDVLGLFGI